MKYFKDKQVDERTNNKAMMYRFMGENETEIGEELCVLLQTKFVKIKTLRYEN